jgi:hypothetical protein
MPDKSIVFYPAWGAGNGKNEKFYQGRCFSLLAISAPAAPRMPPLSSPEERWVSLLFLNYPDRIVFFQIIPGNRKIFKKIYA